MSKQTSQLYDFGPYRLDLARRVFAREGHVIPLAPKTFELLRLLVQSAGRAFSRRELMAALWPDTFVEEANLSFQISVLRKALGDLAPRSGLRPCRSTAIDHGRGEVGCASRRNAGRLCRGGEPADVG